MRLFAVLLVLQFPASMSGVFWGPIKRVEAENYSAKVCYVKFYFGSKQTEKGLALAVAVPSMGKMQYPAFDPGGAWREGFRINPDASGYFYFHSDCEVHINRPWPETVEVKK